MNLPNSPSYRFLCLFKLCLYRTIRREFPERINVLVWTSQVGDDSCGLQLLVNVAWIYSQFTPNVCGRASDLTNNNNKYKLLDILPTFWIPHIAFFSLHCNSPPNSHCLNITRQIRETSYISQQLLVTCLSIMLESSAHIYHWWMTTVYNSRVLPVQVLPAWTHLIELKHSNCSLMLTQHLHLVWWEKMPQLDLIGLIELSDV